MPLAWRQNLGQQLTCAFRPEVDFGAEAALTTSECFGLGAPFGSCVATVLDVV